MHLDYFTEYVISSEIAHVRVYLKYKCQGKPEAHRNLSQHATTLFGVKKETIGIHSFEPFKCISIIDWYYLLIKTGSDKPWFFLQYPAERDHSVLTLKHKKYIIFVIRDNYGNHIFLIKIHYNILFDDYIDTGIF